MGGEIFISDQAGGKIWLAHWQKSRSVNSSLEMSFWAQRPNPIAGSAASPGGAWQKKEAAERCLGHDEEEPEVVCRTESKTKKSFDATDETGGLTSARKQRRWLKMVASAPAHKSSTRRTKIQSRGKDSCARDNRNQEQHIRNSRNQFFIEVQQN
jgi:hypothetical protein